MLRPFLASTTIPWLFIVVFAISIAFAVGLSSHYHRETQHRVQSAVQSSVDVIAARISATLDAQLLAQKRMAARFAERPPSRSEWLSDAKHYVTDFPGYQALEWVDAAGVVRWIMPLAGNEAAQDLDLSKHPARRAILELAQSGHAALSAPIDLVQGGKGLLFPVAISTPETQLGYILGVYRIQQWLDAAVPHDPDIAFALYEAGSCLYERSWDVAVTPTLTSEVRIGGRKWEIQAQATQPLLAAKGSNAPLFSLLLGSAFGALLGLVMQLSLWWRRESALARAKGLALAASEERLELALSSASAGMWDWYPEKNHFFSNATLHTMIGDEPREGAIDADYFFSRVHPDDAEVVAAKIESAATDPDYVYDSTFRLRHTDGSYRWIRSPGRVVERRADGAPIRMIGLHVDVTELRQLEEHLRQASAQAEAANATKSEFLANMSHEIRTPMTAILGYADLLLDPDEDAICKQEAAATIQRNGQHLLTIINDILDLSKLDAGRVEVERLAVSPVDLLLDVQGLMAIRAQGKGLALELIAASPLPDRITTDPTRLRQVLVNVVGNAIKFTEHGSVTIRCRMQGDESLAFEVDDQGIGMTEDQTAHVFEAFAQSDTSTTRQYGGTGLGLAISRRLTRLLGGDIVPVCRLGEGCCFSITIATAPLDDVRWLDPNEVSFDKRRTAEVNSTPDGELEGVRILLAEDGPDNQRLITRLLTKVGAEVTIAEDGELAVELALADRPFDVILMDVQMPKLDGHAATRKLREKGYEGPIIALTAHAMSTDRQKAYDAGCTGFTTKPIRKKELFTLLEQELERTRGVPG